jgi:heme/copper-type cytochrome/quinol oxidase subunit 2
MRRAVRVVDEAEYAAWARGQKALYETSIKGTADDPFQTENAVSEVESTEESMGEAAEMEEAQE